MFGCSRLALSVVLTPIRRVFPRRVTPRHHVVRVEHVHEKRPARDQTRGDEAPARHPLPTHHRHQRDGDQQAHRSLDERRLVRLPLLEAHRPERHEQGAHTSAKDEGFGAARDGEPRESAQRHEQPPRERKAKIVHRDPAQWFLPGRRLRRLAAFLRADARLELSAVRCSVRLRACDDAGGAGGRVFAWEAELGELPEVNLGSDHDGGAAAVVQSRAMETVRGRLSTVPGSVGAPGGRNVVKGRPEERVSGRASSQRHGHPRPGD
mmetsp:Transcript_9751/g.39518  ORF Transcript_9751/g.39518 Transcript_9751/m.39518 type:complete len:265 (+) Transcript_9751:687-1481(+)